MCPAAKSAGARQPPFWCFWRGYAVAALSGCHDKNGHAAIRPPQSRIAISRGSVQWPAAPLFAEIPRDYCLASLRLAPLRSNNGQMLPTVIRRQPVGCRRYAIPHQLGQQTLSPPRYVPLDSVSYRLFSCEPVSQLYGHPGEQQSVPSYVFWAVSIETALYRVRPPHACAQGSAQVHALG